MEIDVHFFSLLCSVHSALLLITLIITWKNTWNLSHSLLLISKLNSMNYERSSNTANLSPTASSTGKSMTFGRNLTMRNTKQESSCTALTSTRVLMDISLRLSCFPTVMEVEKALTFHCMSGFFRVNSTPFLSGLSRARSLCHSWIKTGTPQGANEILVNHLARIQTGRASRGPLKMVPHSGLVTHNSFRIVVWNLQTMLRTIACL